MKRKKVLVPLVLLALLLVFCIYGCGQKEVAQVRDQVVNSMEYAIETTMTGETAALDPDDYPTIYEGIEVNDENLYLFPYTDAAYFAVDQEPELGGISIAYCTSEDPVIVIPDHINGQKVVAINTAAFSGTAYEAIIMPDTIVEVRNAAFQNCSHLKYVHFGTGLKTIEWMAFNTCTHLRRVYIPTGCVTLNGTIFYMCDRLKEIVIPETVTDITAQFLSYDTCPEAVVYTPAGSATEKVLSGTGIPIVHIASEVIEESEAGYRSSHDILNSEEIQPEQAGPITILAPEEMNDGEEDREDEIDEAYEAQKNGNSAEDSYDDSYNDTYDDSYAEQADWDDEEDWDRESETYDDDEE